MTDFRKNRVVLYKPAVGLLIFSFFISITALVVYCAESDFSDKTLFLLLFVLRYSSFLLCLCSVFLLIAGIRDMIRNPSVVSAAMLVLFLCGILYGAGIIIFDALIITFSGGKK
jgi:hypothetical protein